MKNFSVRQVPEIFVFNLKKYLIRAVQRKSFMFFEKYRITLSDKYISVYKQILKLHSYDH